MHLKEALKENLNLALPLIGSKSFIAARTFLAMMMLGQLSRLDLAAGALISSMTNLLLVVCFGFLYAVGILISHAFGASQEQELVDILHAGWALGSIIALPVMLLMWFSYPILILLHQPISVAVLVARYFKIFAVAVLPSLWFINCTQFLMAIGRQHMILIFSAIAFCVLLVLAELLMFGHLGLPKLGIAGLAIAMDVTFWLNFLMAFLYLVFSQFCRIYSIFFYQKHLLKENVKRLFLLGFPIALQFAAGFLGWFIYSIMIGWLGVEALGAQQIVLQFSTLALMIPFGLAQAISILVAKAAGKKERENIKILVKASLLIMSAFMLLMGAFYFLEPHLLIAFYLKGNMVFSGKIGVLACGLFYVVAIGQFFTGFNNILTGALRGLKDIKMPMWISIFGMFAISIPLGYLIGFGLGGGLIGVRSGFIIGAIVAAILLYRRFYRA